MRRLAPLLALVLLAAVGLVWFVGSSGSTAEARVAAVAPRPDVDESDLVPIARSGAGRQSKGEAEAGRANVVTVEQAEARARARYPRARILGEVTDLAGKGLEAARVSAQSNGERWVQRDVYPGDVSELEVLTDEEGRFELSAPVPTSRSVTISVRASEFHVAAERDFAQGWMTLVAGDNELGTFVLAPAGVCAGRVTDAAGKPVASATIELRASPGGHASSAVASLDDGTYRVAHVPPGTYSVEVSADGRLTGRVEEVEIAAGEITSDIDFKLGAAIALSGRVFDDDGVALSDVLITSRPVSRGSESSTRSAEDGRFTLSLRVDEEHSINAVLEGYQEFDPHFQQHVAAETEELVIVLPRFELTHFVVLDVDSGAPVREFGLKTVVMRKVAGQLAKQVYDRPTAVTQHRNGEVELPGDPRYHDFSIVAPGYAPQRGKVRWDEGSGDTQTLLLVPGGTLVGRLVAFGEPVPWPALHISADLLPLRFGLVEQPWTCPCADWAFDVDDFPRVHEQLRGEKDGSFRIEDLSPGTYELVLRSGKYAPRKVERIRIISGQTTDLGAIQAFKPAEIQGRITLDGEQSVAGLTISLGHARMADRGTSQITDASGTFSFKGLTADAHYLCVDEQVGVLTRWSPTKVQLAPGELRYVWLDLKHRIPCELEVHVLLNGKPVPDLRVHTLSASEHQGSEFVGRTNADGLVLGQLSSRGMVSLWVGGEHGLSVGWMDGELNLRAGEHPRADLEFEAGRLVVTMPPWLAQATADEDWFPLVVQTRGGSGYRRWPIRDRSEWESHEGGARIDLGWVAVGEYDLSIEAGLWNLHGEVAVKAGAEATCELVD